MSLQCRNKPHVVDLVISHINSYIKQLSICFALKLFPVCTHGFHFLWRPKIPENQKNPKKQNTETKQPPQKTNITKHTEANKDKNTNKIFFASHWMVHSCGSSPLYRFSHRLPGGSFAPFLCCSVKVPAL